MKCFFCKCRRRDTSFDGCKKECFSIEDGSDMPLRTTSQLIRLKEFLFLGKVFYDMSKSS